MPTFEAGGDLDAMVAEKIMGLMNVRLERHVQGEDLFAEQHGETIWVPSFSTDISAAWDVVEKLRLWVLPGEDGGWCAGKMDLDSHLAPYIDTVGGRVDGAFDVIACASTAPLAICRAALAAVEAQ